VCAAYFQALRIGALRVLAVVAALLWLQGLTRPLPALVAWFPGLLGALLAALAFAYGALECRWTRRGRPAVGTRAGMPVATSTRESVRDGLLSAWGVLALPPIAAALGSSGAQGLLPALWRPALAVLAAGLGWEYAGRVRARRTVQTSRA